MHGIIKEWKKADTRFIWGFDTGGSTGCDSIVEVARLIDGKWVTFITRDFYFSDASEQSVMNFTNRVINDPAYREKIANFETEWQRSNKIYEDIEAILYKTMENKPHFLGYESGNKAAERQFNKLQREYDSFCEELYSYIKENIKRLWEDWQKDKNMTRWFILSQQKGGLRKLLKEII
ncbi:hypothetical protein M1112_00440 [Candidatus Parvarchaeota archaeon]|jgi:hypothetical protein|nr:hypothetical protein [Candidatus Parvarchaeota archaeon]